MSQIALDDPRVDELMILLHEASGHDWQPACGLCFDRAYNYLTVLDILSPRDHPFMADKRGLCIYPIPKDGFNVPCGKMKVIHQEATNR